MKVLQINALFGNKSTGSIVRDIHRMLIDSGEESRVVCISKSGDDDGVLALGYGIGCRIHALLSRVNGKQGFYSRASTKRLLSVLADDKPDIIHIHNLHSNFINMPLLFDFASKNGIPIVMTLHDAWYFTGKCYHFLDNGCDRWQSECHDCPKRKKDIPSLIDASRSTFRKKKKMYSTVDLHVVGCSRWITDCASRSPMLSGAKFRQIYNGVDSTVFNGEGENLRDKLSLGEGFVILTMANKWFDPKNAEAREAALGFVAERGARLVIVGCSEGRMSEYKDNANVTCLGYVTDREYLASLYRSADLFLNLTLVDTLPTVNIESAMCGTPIVTYGSGGSGELVLEGKTGFVVAPLDASMLVSRIERVMAGEIERNECARFAVDNFEKSENYKKYLSLYREIQGNERVGKNG